MMTTDEIRDQNLQRANEVRYARADMKRRIRSGDLSPAELLADPPPALERVEVGEFLCWLPRVGPQRATRALRSMRPAVAPRVRIGVLGALSRRVLIETIERQLVQQRRVPA